MRSGRQSKRSLKRFTRAFIASSSSPTPTNTTPFRPRSARARSITSSRKLARPTHYGADLFTVVKPLLAREAGRQKFRLIGVGVRDLAPSENADAADLLGATTDHAVEDAVDKVRRRLGKDMIKKGRGFSP